MFSSSLSYELVMLKTGPNGLPLLLSFLPTILAEVRAAINSRPALDKLYKGFVPKLKSLPKRGKR